MTSTIAAITTGGGGVVTTADASGNLSLLSGATTILAATATGVAVTGTLSATGGVTLTTPLPVASGGTGAITVAAAQTALGIKFGQIVSTTLTSVATGTTIIPFDNTGPSNTEGNEYITRSITPANASSTLVIDVLLNVSPSTAAIITAALFQDSNAASLAAGAIYSANNGVPYQVGFKYLMTAGTTSATTFKVRAGLQVAGTLTVNGASGAGLYDGRLTSYITITEVLP